MLYVLFAYSNKWITHSDVKRYVGRLQSVEMKFLHNINKWTSRDNIQNKDSTQYLKAETQQQKLVKLRIELYGHVLHANDINIILRASKIKMVNIWLLRRPWAKWRHQLKEDGETRHIQQPTLVEIMKTESFTHILL